MATRASAEIDSSGLGARIEALPGLRRGREPRPSGRGRRPISSAARSATRSSAAERSRPRPGGRRRPAGARRGARRRGPSPRALRHRDRRDRRRRAIDVARARAETYASARGAARGAARPGSRRTSPAATSASTRWRSPLADPARADRPARRARATCEPGCCGYCTSGSFVDDPTRALRAARYAARLGLELEPRRRARCCARPTSAPSPPTGSRPSCAGSPPSRRRGRGFELLAGGVWSSSPTGAARADRRGRRRSLREPSRGARSPGAADAIARRRPRRPPAASRARRGRARGRRRRRSRRRAAARAVELALARALGAGWLDDYVASWRERPARDRRRRPARGRRPRGPGGRPRARGGAAGEARRRGRRPRARAAARARRPQREAGFSRRWTGASATGCAGSRPACRAPARRFSTRLGGVSERAVRQPQPRPADRRRAGARCARTAAGWPPRSGVDARAAS